MDMRLRPLLLLLLIPFALASVQNLFLPDERPEGYAVTCEGKTYEVYMVVSGDTLRAAIVLRDGNVVEDFSEYNRALQTAWYHRQLSRVLDALRFYTPDTASSLQSLANRMQNKEYDLQIAAKRLRELNLFEHAQDVEELDDERQLIVERLRTLASDLDRASRELLRFAKSPFCGYRVDTTVYDDFDEFYRLLAGYNQHARSIMAALASADADPAALSMIIKYISPPFDMAEIDSLHASAAAEREAFAHVSPIKDARSLFKDAEARFSRASYIAFVSQRITTAGDLRQTVEYILSTWPADDPDVQTLRARYEEMQRLASQGKYDEALRTARSVKRLALSMIERGPPEEATPVHVYVAVAIIFALVAYMVLRRRGGGEEEDVDYGLAYGDLGE